MLDSKEVVNVCTITGEENPKALDKIKDKINKMFPKLGLLNN
jgi:hypothetical protein